MQIESCAFSEMSVSSAIILKNLDLKSHRSRIYSFMHFIFTLLNRFILKDPIKLVVKRYFRECVRRSVFFIFRSTCFYLFISRSCVHIDRATCSADVNVCASWCVVPIWHTRLSLQSLDNRLVKTIAIISSLVILAKTTCTLRQIWNIYTLYSKKSNVTNTYVYGL